MIVKKKRKKCIDRIKLDIYVFIKCLEDEYVKTAVCSSLVAAVYRRYISCLVLKGQIFVSCHGKFHMN
jgi:hypothetical protein